MTLCKSKSPFLCTETVMMLSLIVCSCEESRREVMPSTHMRCTLSIVEAIHHAVTCARIY